MEYTEVLTQLQNFEEVEKLSNDPYRVSQYQVFLAVSLWKVGKEIIETEKAYNKAWDLIRQEVGSDTQADKRVSVTDEWVSMKRAKNTYKVVEESIKSLKKMLGLANDEAKTQW